MLPGKGEVLGTIVSTAVGGVISLVVSLYFYKRADTKSQQGWDRWFQSFQDNQARWRLFEHQNARYLQNNAHGLEWDVKLYGDTVVLTNLTGHNAVEIEFADLETQRLIQADVVSGTYSIPVIEPFDRYALRLGPEACNKPGFIIQWVNMGDYTPPQSCRLRTTRELYFNPFELLAEFRDLQPAQSLQQAETQAPFWPIKWLDDEFVRENPGSDSVPFPSDFVGPETYKAVEID